MRNSEIAAALDAEADRSCDDGAIALLRLAARALRQGRHGGPCQCLGCTRQAEVDGVCRPCYQRRRRGGPGG